MKTITKIILGISILFLLMGVVSANENTTDIVSDTSTTSATPEIVVEDYTTDYNNYGPLKISLKDKNGNLVTYQDINVEFYGDVDEDINYIANTYDTGVTLDNPIQPDAGEYDVFISTNYLGKDYSKWINVKINKSPAKITAYKVTATNTHYVTLKSIVSSQGWTIVNDLSDNGGTVTFTINGKTYKTNVDWGWAEKKVKLTKAGTYTYKATYTGKNYKTVTTTGKVILKYPTKTVTVKAGKHKKVFGERIDCNIKDQDGSIRKKPSVMITCNGIDMPKHTKLLKAKMYFKNKRTGKIITKTSSKVKWSAITFKLPANYKVYKVKVWYKYK